MQRNIGRIMPGMVLLNRQKNEQPRQPGNLKPKEEKVNNLVVKFQDFFDEKLKEEKNRLEEERKRIQGELDKSLEAEVEKRFKIIRSKLLEAYKRREKELKNEKKQLTTKQEELTAKQEELRAKQEELNVLLEKIKSFSNGLNKTLQSIKNRQEDQGVIINNIYTSLENVKSNINSVNTGISALNQSFLEQAKQAQPKQAQPKKAQPKQAQKQAKIQQLRQKENIVDQTLKYGRRAAPSKDQNKGNVLGNQ